MWLINRQPTPGNLPAKIHAGTYEVGRSLDCDIVVGDKSVSRRHARLTCLFATVIALEDLESTNGTFVDDKRITQCDIVPPCTIRFGLVELDLVTAPPFLAALQDSDTEGVPTDQVAISDPPQILANLTGAQREVLAYLRRGLDEMRIAHRLERSHYTIHNHIRNIYAALGVHSRDELWAKLLHRP